ncbi:helix-turn-helix domain-containing protein [Brevibacillus ruminantium]|uniref:Helix-turn-helix domain-containing protein n=1 Tax=Brevibacillus ruminantium TaxID=2950604 RepID=A0ABY4WFW6_9BACL|nr:helix-turn-helix domain-containing protein [Brevibacillus ruminantium]USG63551.1 helix-turn-helix domain-containing protein [Brevibacillus ruminantium]
MSSPTLNEREWTFVCTLVLGGFMPLAHERTVQSLYYILRGRKANQTLQDVHLYSLYPYYRLFPRLLKEDWAKIVEKLQADELFISIPATGDRKKPSFYVTDKGKQVASEGAERFCLPDWFAPFTSADIPEKLEVFWLRLHLLVQTVSYLLKKDLSFQPVVQEKRVQQWVKQRLADRRERERWEEGLSAELFHCLSTLPESVQEIIIRLFSGVSQSGQTLTQLGRERQEASSYIHVQHRFGLARVLHLLREKPEQFPLLSALLEDDRSNDPRLTESASQTYMLVKRGTSIEEIAKRRGIKPSTVEDHLVEIALRCPEWSCSDYLAPQLAEQIVELSNHLGTSRLRLIKDRIGANVSYLQIRLALAKRREEG